MKQTIYILTFLVFTSCGQSNSEKTTTTTANTDTVTPNDLKTDTVELKETYNEEDLPVNEYLTDRLKPIRANFKRINSITKWASIDTEELSESTEGGEAKFYYQNGQLEKIVARHYGETFQLLTEYYLLNGQLSFVFEKRHKYNRPLYYDSTAMKENNDTEAFDFLALAGLPKKHHAAAVCCVRAKQHGKDTRGKNYRNSYLSFYNYGSVNY